MLENELKLKRYKITVRLKRPYVLVDEFPKRPTTEDCMNIFIDALTQHALDDDLEIKIIPITSRRIDSPII